MTLAKLLNLSEPLYVHLYNADNNICLPHSLFVIKRFKWDHDCKNTAKATTSVSSYCFPYCFLNSGYRNQGSSHHCPVSYCKPYREQKQHQSSLDKTLMLFPIQQPIHSPNLSSFSNLLGTPGIVQSYLALNL